MFLGGNLRWTMGLVGAFLGIAEAARAAIVALVTTRRKGTSGRTLAERYPIQHTIAEIEIDLAASRAMLSRTALLADTLFQQYPQGSIPLDTLHQQMKDFQCTKWFVTRKAIEIVDRALTASGGGGLSELESALSALPRRAGGAVHATVLAERGIRVHRQGDARSRSAPGGLTYGGRLLSTKSTVSIADMPPAL